MKKCLIILAAPIFMVSLSCDRIQDTGVADSGRIGGTIDSLNPRVRELVLDSMDRTDRLWDERADLLWSAKSGNRDPAAKEEPTRYQQEIRSRLRTERVHDVRRTSYYALGLLLRGRQKDHERALRALHAVLDQQIDQPGLLYHGTFYRSPEESPPPTNPQDLVWTHYDPNWRQFIGTTLAMILEEYADRLPDALVERIEAALRTAVEGEKGEFRSQHRGRSGGPQNKGLEDYTNIALMHAFLWTYAGVRLRLPEWIDEGEEFAGKIYANFKRFGTFEEYNSPTYYGVDLFALALWRAYGPTEALRRMGAEMEAELWKDIAAHYHAGLKNMAGPYSRAYGMDMNKYTQMTGLWLRTVLEADKTPLPERGDFDYAPHLAILGTMIPDVAMPHFKGFVEERRVRRVITPKRVATSWIGRDYMLGAEDTTKTRLVASRGEPAAHQFYPVTVHWRTPSGDVAWIKLIDSSRLDAAAERGVLSISAIGDATFRIVCTGIEAESIQRDRWNLPGLTVHVDSDALDAIVAPGDGHVDVQYLDATEFVLNVTAPVQD